MTVYIDRELCKGCGLCLHFCPRDVLAMTGETNNKGYAIAGVLHPERCIACGLCDLYCPDLAIYLAPAEASSQDEEDLD